MSRPASATGEDGRAPAVDAPVLAVSGSPPRRRLDRLATEEPMEVRVAVKEGGRVRRHPIAVTMRTPGHDFELAAGFLFSEGVVRERSSVRDIAYCPSARGEAAHNVVNVSLAPGTAFDPERFSRNVLTTASCGMCGKTSIDLVRTVCSTLPVGELRLDRRFFLDLPGSLRQAQVLFSQTGGLHAAALFSPEGELLLLREDIGRHNALDKVVGALLLEGRLPASDTVLMVSGRAGYELVQKAVLAGIPVLAAVGAPSSLAVDLAREYGVTLIGFLRKARFNVYAGEERVAEPS